MRPDRSAIFGKNKTGPLPIAEKSARMRKQRQVDATSLMAFFSELSEQTLFSRFMIALPTVPPSIFERLCDVDGNRHVGIVALDSNGNLIAEARYIRDQDSETSAEFALSIAEGWRGIGLATSMMKEIETEAQKTALKPSGRMSWQRTRPCSPSPASWVTRSPVTRTTLAASS